MFLAAPPSLKISKAEKEGFREGGGYGVAAIEHGWAHCLVLTVGLIVWGKRGRRRRGSARGSGRVERTRSRSSSRPSSRADGSRESSIYVWT